MDPEQYCQARAAASGSSFYYAFRFLPDDKRRAITALYAFCREVDDIVDEVSDRSIARIKLDWWRTELDRMYEGDAQHPVTRALQPAIEQYALPREHFEEILDGMEMDLDQSSYESFRELALYCYRAAGVVGLMSAEIFGYENRRTQRYATELGTALQLTNIIRDVREDARRGRVYIPMDEMARFGVRQHDLKTGNRTDNLQALLQYQAQRARSYYDHAFEVLPEEDRYRQRSGIIMGEIYRTLLDEIEQDDFDVLTHKVALTPVRKLWIAWRTARRERRRAHR